jgi:glucosamine--fructose-6-phosphate aminotransferase (isomerizing)
MAETELTRSRLALDIEAQPDSLGDVLKRQCGDGLAPALDAAALLRSAKRVVIVGIGASMFASITLCYALCARGVDATVVEAAEFLHYRHRAFRDAVLIVVSRSGESVEIRRLLEIVGHKQPVIGITNEPESLLAREARVCLLLGSRADEFVAIQTYTGTLLTMHILVRLMDESPSIVHEEIERLLTPFASLVSTSLENSHEWDKFFEHRSPLYLLSRGPSLASACEGALLFNEIAKFSAIGSAIASFRHGPFEVVDNRFNGFVFAPEGPTRELNLGLAEDIVRCGGSVRVVGPRRKGGPEIEWCETPAVPEGLAPLFDIVPIQVAAMRLAQLQGIRPGSFRYTPQVAVDEARFSLPPQDAAAK